MPTLKKWEEIIKKLPERSGVYIFKNRHRYIYIGKAKNLRKRLLQHLRAVKEDPKEFQIFAQSESLDYIVTESEYEALVLERQLINIHKPKYNVVFKYGGGYPMLVLTEEDFPTVKIVRDFEEKGHYFGPFFNLNQARRVKSLVHKLFKLRTCSEMPSPGKLCMDYHLGLCSAPCVGKISKEDYRLAAESAKAFLSGEVGQILPKLYEKMEECIKRLEFERCQFLKEQITALENLTKGQRVLNLPFTEADVWVNPEGSKRVYLYLIRAKKLVDKREFEIPEAYDSGFESWLLAYYSVNYIPERVYYEGVVNDRGNLERFLSQRSGKTVKVSPGIPETLKPLVEINLKTPAVEYDQRELFERVLKIPFPERIEGFDISHFMGEAVVGSCVVWEKGRMNKKCYRRYRIKTVEGIDDYASLKEILSRRALRIKKGQYPVPDMWLIDGGKGQLNVALEVKRHYKLPTFVVALAKREEILFTEDGRQIPLKEYPALYRIFGLIRDEAHRFALSYNRKLREKKILGKLTDRERRVIERNFESVYEILETPDERLKKLGLEPSLKQKIKREYGDGSVSNEG